MDQERTRRDGGAPPAGIERTPGVVGGAACIARTRIPVWLLESYRRLGLDEPRILANYPTLQASHFAHCWAYVASHRDEIEGAIRANETA